MPLILVKKIYKSGNSYHITIPMHWLRSKEMLLGKFPTSVKMEVNSDIVITAVPERRK